MYINGIAIGVLELKRSTISLGDGIRQNIVNQQKEFIESFFSTIQLVMAGNFTFPFQDFKRPFESFTKRFKDKSLIYN